MANRKANEKRCLIRVPISFRDRVYREADEQRVTCPLYLEDKMVVPISKVVPV